MASFILHKPKQIRIPVYISSKPQEALGKVKRLETRLTSGIQAFYDPQLHGVQPQWECVLPFREHLLSALFSPEAEYEDLVDEVLMLAPPVTVHLFEPRRRA